MATTRTLAIQIDDELFERINVYIKQKGLKKREFLLNLIETALAEDEGTTEQVESTDESEDTSDGEVESTEESEDTTDGEVESTEDEAQGNDNTLRAMFRNY